MENSVCSVSTEPTRHVCTYFKLPSSSITDCGNALSPTTSTVFGIVNDFNFSQYSNIDTGISFKFAGRCISCKFSQKAKLSLPIVSIVSGKFKFCNTLHIAKQLSPNTFNLLFSANSTLFKFTHRKNADFPINVT